MDDKNWFREHLKELREKYEGKLVAVLNGEVIAVGTTLDEIGEVVNQKREKNLIKGVPFTGKASEDIAAVHIPPVIT